MSDDLMTNMLHRVELCRRSADAADDDSAAAALRLMANEIEADLRLLEAERAGAKEKALLKPRQSDDT
jgi:hypothetical protein